MHLIAKSDQIWNQRDSNPQSLNSGVNVLPTLVRIMLKYFQKAVKININGIEI